MFGSRLGYMSVFGTTSVSGSEVSTVSVSGSEVSAVSVSGSVVGAISGVVSDSDSRSGKTWIFHPR